MSYRHSQAEFCQPKTERRGPRIRALDVVTWVVVLVLGMACGGPVEATPTLHRDLATATLRASPLVATRTTAPPPTATPSLPPPTAAATTPAPEAATLYGYRVVAAYPHDPDAFTQGLVYEDGWLYEGTGLRGRSSLRKVELETGSVVQILELPAQHFGEGVTIFGDRIFQITWQSNVGFVYDRDSFELLQEFYYSTEGWGITHDGERLIMSDGTATLHFLDPETLQETDHVSVRDEGSPVARLNELEYIQGEVYANVWQTDLIARIDPQTGRVTAWIDLTGLLQLDSYAKPVDVLNGIAYDAEGDRLFVTGKLWPSLFEIELTGPGY